MILYNDVFLKHDCPHIENKNRVLAIKKALIDLGIKYYSPQIEEDPIKYIEKAHDKQYIEMIKSLIDMAKEMGCIYIDGDTYLSKDSWDPILYAVYYSVYAVNNDFLFAVVRPPGHHAGKYGKANAISQGFCIFNNAAIAALNYKGRVAIVDIDLHHGNGTEDIVKHNKNIRYYSIYAKDIYPLPDNKSYDNIYKYPLPIDATNEDWISSFDLLLANLIEWDPDKVIVSLGFDAHKDDPLSVFRTDYTIYKYAFQKLAQFNPTYILEGGYNYDVLYNGTKLLIKFSRS